MKLILMAVFILITSQLYAQLTIKDAEKRIELWDISLVLIDRDTLHYDLMWSPGMVIIDTITFYRKYKYVGTSKTLIMCGKSINIWTFRSFYEFRNTLILWPKS